MSIFKCKMCGGTLEINENQTTAVCEYCGTKQTLPKLDDDRRANLYDRANHFRRNNEFDKAMSIYEKILTEDGSDAEAYWSLVLSGYGIEYVEDPATHKRVPTVNRAQFTSIFDDDNYKSALKYADAYQKAIYEEEANAINEIQKGILAISQNEEPFDVFICYKETDANGRRTQDSVLANDLYHQLIQEGFKVFFSRITLEDKLGTAYEPYIFAALNSAKVMVVLGTKPEYFNAVWVRNEWSRYLALVKNSGGKKVLIPAYKDMDPYDLPEEFSHLQAQDMSKLGFMQDLIRGIKKLTVVEKTAPVVKGTIVNNNTNVNTNSLLERAFMFLEDGDWNSADEYCEKVLDQDPKNAEAYLGKLMAELGCKKREELKDCDETFEDSSNYQKAVRFGSSQLKSELEGYVAFILDRNEQERLNGIYNKAFEMMQNAVYEIDYNLAAEAFEEIINYKDVKEKYDECLEKAEVARKDAVYKIAIDLMEENRIESFKEAIDELQQIQDWKDASEKIAICNNKIEELKVQIEKERIEKEKKAEETKKKTIKLVKNISPIIAVLIVLVIVLNAVILPYAHNKKDYNNAIALYEQGEYDEAISAFEKLGDFKDSKEQIDICTEAKYQNALSLLENKKYDEAISAFSDIEDVKDSADKIKAIKYDKAMELYEAGKYRDSLSLFVESNGYKDSNEKISLINRTRFPQSAISTSSSYTVALKSDGTVVAYGWNKYGQCNVSDWTDIVAISTGDNHTVGLKSDGTVIAVGNNDDGQCDVSDWTDIVAISAGYGHTVGLKSDGTVVADGNNYKGTCDVSNWTNIVSVSAGLSHTVGLKSDETIIAVGNNDDGQCNVSDWTDIVAISAGDYHTVGLKSDGTVVAVGWNIYGQCDVNAWTDIVAISAGRSHTVGLKSDGTVVAVGDNINGQCNVSAWKDIVAVSAGDSYTVGLKSDGTVVAVGDNTFGQCDVGDWKDIKIPGAK